MTSSANETGPIAMSNPPSSLLKRSAYAVGTLVFIASVAFLAAYTYRNWSAIGSIRLVNPAYLFAAIGAYGISHLSTGLSWPLAIRGLGMPIPLATGIKIGLVAQIGKYLPGNVAHYFGRAALAADAGITIKASGISTAVEILAALLAAALVAGLATFVDPAASASIPFAKSENVQSPLLAMFAILATLIGFGYYLRRNAIGIAVITYPTLCLCISFLLSGVSLWALLVSIGGTDLSSSAIIAVFAVAWVSGFLIPGAPAGLGVREAILIAFMAPQIGSGSALGVALLHRVLTAGVDLLAAVAGYAAWMRLKT